ncbi:MAG TPA: hypothetical protein VFB32_05565 [Rudaea sp.]|nr:hypothetical protein [Rudaea sp.]
MKSKWMTALAILPLIAASVASILFSLSSDAAPAAATPAYLGDFPNFNPKLSTELPGDVDTALQKKLDGEKRFAQEQRLFDLWSWQAFIALNWPTNNAGQFAPQPSDTAFGPPKWTTWYESTAIFRQDGGVPAPCGKPPAARALSLTREANLPVARDLKPFTVPQAFDKRRTRLLGNISAVGETSPATPAAAKGQKPEALEDILQAFTAPLIDQNGNYVFYEIEIDPNEVGYICAHKLYNINGQVAFTGGNPNTKADLPSGVDTQDASGSWELKFAWRILIKGDDRSRYLTSAAIVPPVNGKCPDGTAPQRDQCDVEVGLVGMHIGHKTASSPQWIWATFEQVDNLSVDNVAHPALKPSFFDPNCPICLPDEPPAQLSNGNWASTPPTQVWRAIPIPADKVALNGEAEAALGKAGSALAYYQLVDTQWPTEPTKPPTKPEAGLPGAVENKPGGDPTPVFLTNITMETYFQKGAQAACHQEETQNCPAGNWLSANQQKTANADMTSIFATESCMGCHSSAGLYITPTKTSGQLMGDFSWLFSQKAHLASGGK